MWISATSILLFAMWAHCLMFIACFDVMQYPSFTIVAVNSFHCCIVEITPSFSVSIFVLNCWNAVKSISMYFLPSWFPKSDALSYLFMSPWGMRCSMSQRIGKQAQFYGYFISRMSYFRVVLYLWSQCCLQQWCSIENYQTTPPSVLV